MEDPDTQEMAAMADIPSTKLLDRFAVDLIFQMSGKMLCKEKCCPIQGDADFQIAYHYLKSAFDLGSNVQAQGITLPKSQ